MSRIKYSPLYLEAKIELIKMIKKGDFKNNKLPPEDKLSEMLGISRSTIREALITLDREGIITKKQGIGNLIHKSTLETKMRIDLIRDFLKLLEDGGYKATVKRIKSGWTDKLTQFDTKIPSFFRDRKYFLIEFLYLADNQPAILAVNIIPESVLNTTPQSEEMPFDSFKKYLNLSEIDLAFRGKEKFLFPKISDCSIIDDSKLNIKVDDLFHNLESFISFTQPNVLFVIDAEDASKPDLIFTFNMTPQLPKKLDENVLTVDVYLDKDRKTRDVNFLKREADYNLIFLKDIKEISHAELYTSSFSLVLHIKSLNKPI